VEFLAGFLEGLAFINEFAELPMRRAMSSWLLSSHQVLLKDTIEMEERLDTDNKDCSHLKHICTYPGYTD
jgi:hypothetical protein